ARAASWSSSASARCSAPPWRRWRRAASTSWTSTWKTRSSSTRAARGGRCRSSPEKSAMIRALAVKELREVFPIAALGLGVQLVLVAALVGMKPFADWLPLSELGVPFQGRVLAPAFGTVGVAFTLLLGFRQSAWEAGRGTYKFLLHRPIP